MGQKNAPKRAQQQANLEHHPKVPIDPARTHQEKPKRMNARVTVASRSRVATVCGANLKVRCAGQTVRGARFEGFKAHAAAGNQPNISDSIDEDVIPSGEWPANWSLASYEDVGEYYAGQILKEEQGNMVSGIMTTNIVTSGPTDTVQSVKKLFDHVSGVPVVDSEGVCVGIVSRKDLNKSGKSIAAIMLKYKVNRLPVVSRDGEVIGIVSRTDIFT